MTMCSGAMETLVKSPCWVKRESPWWCTWSQRWLCKWTWDRGKLDSGSKTETEKKKQKQKNGGRFRTLADFERLSFESGHSRPRLSSAIPCPVYMARIQGVSRRGTVSAQRAGDPTGGSRRDSRAADTLLFSAKIKQSKRLLFLPRHTQGSSVCYI